MKRENRSHILIRFGVIIVAIFIFAAMVVYHALDNTVLSAHHWNALAMKELSRVDTIPPERGEIHAADGSILATNLCYYDVRIDFRSEKFMEKAYRAAVDSLADSLAKHFPIRKRDEWRKRLMTPVLIVEKNKRPRAFKLLGNITDTQYQLLRTFPFFNIKNRNRNGLRRDPVMRRVNPYGSMAQRSIGRVGIDSVTGQRHGVSGLERALDSLLYGTPGLAKKIPLTKDIVNWTDVPPVDGYNIRTTIDINMQDIVENSLNEILTTCDAEWGVAVLMEVSTGNIKAISNLEKSKYRPEYIEGMNRAVLGFEPGSVVKTLSMMIAVEDGIVTNVNQVITTGSGFAYAGGRPITDSHSCPSMPIREVIERSSNIGMAKIITSRYGDNPGAFYSRLKRLGFLDPMHTGISGERTPRIDSVANNRGGRISLSRMCYGYATEIPPLYTLSIYNAIANDGVYVRPRLVEQLSSPTTGVDSILPISYMGNGRACSPRTAAIMRDMLTQVVWGEHGTGRMLRNDKVRIAGKTGTCYMVAKGGGYDTGRKRLAFCGFFPAEKPKYSCIVLTCAPKRNLMGAASTSGNVLKAIALKMYSRGMLDNHSDFRADAPANPGVPTLFAASPDKIAKVRDGFAMAHVKQHHAPSTKGDALPGVVGCSLREAINRLESAGAEVTFSGSGFVAAQSLPAGSTPARGARVHLTLRQ